MEKEFEFRGKRYRQVSRMITHDDLMTKTQTHCRDCEGNFCSFYNMENEHCLDWIEDGSIPDCVNWESIQSKTGLYEYFTFHEIKSEL